MYMNMCMVSLYCVCISNGNFQTHLNDLKKNVMKRINFDNFKSHLNLEVAVGCTN